YAGCSSDLGHAEHQRLQHDLLSQPALRSDQGLPAPDADRHGLHGAGDCAQRTGQHAQGAGRVGHEAGWRRLLRLGPRRAPPIPDLMSALVAFMFDTLPSALPAAKAGKVKALAQTCATRSPSAPDLPTMEEAGFADFAIEGWYGIFAPAGTPRAVVDRLSADINRVLKEPASLERWKTLGFDPIGTTPEAFAERQKADLAYWKKMIDYTGIKVE